MEQNKRLRCGFTTGTCAAIAAKAATKMLLGEEIIAQESIMTPKGIEVCTAILNGQRVGDKFSCGVKKDAGDDPDVTNGIEIYASVALSSGEKIEVTGGEGVGIVTKAGLSQTIGEYAINPVPKQMIEKEVREVLDKKGYFCGARVSIYVPEGREVAKRTFNPRLGIEGGISILGTTGIVEPMSEKALLESISVEMNVAKANGTKRLILTPGNYGEVFIRDSLKLELSEAIKCSNFVGESIDMAVEKGFESILLVGHVGKFVKLAAGIMNTHSHQADGRMEVFVAHAALAGVPRDILQHMMECVTTNEVIEILKESGYLAITMDSIMKKVDFHIRQRCMNTIPIGAVLFSNEFGLLGITEEGKRLFRD